MQESFLKAPGASAEAALQRTVNEQLLVGLLALAVEPAATPQVRALAMQALETISQLEPSVDDADWRAHFAAAKRLARAQLERGVPADWAPPPAPPGSPIGQ